MRSLNKLWPRKEHILAFALSLIMTIPNSKVPLLHSAENSEIKTVSLNGPWKFKTDLQDTGMKEEWYGNAFDDLKWSTMAVPSFWKAKEFQDYDGAAWYRTRISTSLFSDNERVALSFGAVDDDCAVWLNGEKLGEHKGWNEPFYFDVTSNLRKSSENVIAVRVFDWGLDGGIWKNVNLRTFKNEDDLLQGEFFLKPALKSADWVKDAILYEVYLRSFSDDGKLGSLEGRLMELKNMGVTCLWLMPIHPVGVVKKKGTLGCPYSVKDYLGVSLEYGTKNSFKRFVEEAHAIGLKVIIDWVAGHTSWDNSILKSNPEWYRKDKKGDIIPPNPDWWDSAGLDYNSAGLRKYMKEAMVSWVSECDVDGFRCDVADAMPVDFWEDVRKSLRKNKPEILMLAEGDRPENHIASFDLTYSWSLYDALVDIVKGKSDVTLLDARLKSEYYKFPRDSMHLYFSENHDKPRAADIFGPAHFAAAVLVFSLEGVPLIYSGQEIGETHQPSLFEKEAIDWKTGLKNFSSIRKFYKKLIAIRKEHPSIPRGQRFRVHTSDDKRIFAFAKSYRDDAVIVALNFSPKEFRGTLELPEIFSSQKGALRLKPLFQGGEISLGDKNGANLVLPPWGYQIWALR